MTIRNHFTLLAGLFLPCILAAQAPIYIRPEPPAKQSVFDIRLRYMFAPDVSFSGMGEVPMGEGFVTPGDPAGGQLRQIRYDDGKVTQDLIEVPGTDTGVPNNDGTTGNYSFTDPDQVSADRKTIDYHRYAANSMDPNQSFVGNASSSMGWELNYTRFINKKRNLGFQMGFSFNGFDSRFNETLMVDLVRDKETWQVADPEGKIPEMEPADDDGNQPAYTGNPVQQNDGSELADTPISSTSEVIPDGALVNSRMDMRSAMYNFRAGPTYSVDFGKKFAFSLGAGVSALFIDGEFAASERITGILPDENGEGSKPFTKNGPRAVSRSNDWQVSGYLDASAHWNVSERVSFFSGMQYQTGTNFNQSNESRQVDIDFSSQVYMHAGFGIRF